MKSTRRILEDRKCIIGTDAYGDEGETAFPAWTVIPDSKRSSKCDGEVKEEIKEKTALHNVFFGMFESMEKEDRERGQGNVEIVAVVYRKTFR